MRRVVVGTNEEGKSLVLSESVVGSADGPAAFRVGGGLPNVKVPGIPEEIRTEDVLIVNLWKSGSSAAADVAVDEASDATDFAMEPGAGGLYWRYHVWGAGHTAEPHKTNTLDLMHVLSGDITLRLDTGDVTLQAGDALVLQAAQHGWKAGDQGCTFVHLMRALE
ncbi:hypothetical protein [Modestobacter excelsi]|uniref:hypothetical protein n=1 Tax=Modestobacter excelsi TaxID=2213161 RepID=UPI00110CE0BC|nr:hypothetical protein [Modestobacter excelsi]